MYFERTANGLGFSLFYVVSLEENACDVIFKDIKMARM